MVARVAQEQEDGVDGPIARLERNPTLERLNIAHPRFRFDRDDPIGSAHDGIPGAQVERAGAEKPSLGVEDRNLNSPRETDAESNAEPLQQHELGRIAQRLARWERPGGQVEPKDSEDLRESHQRDLGRLAAEDPGNLPTGDPQRSSDRRVGQVRRSPRLFRLATEVSRKALAASPTSIDWALPHRHGRSV